MGPEALHARSLGEVKPCEDDWLHSLGKEEAAWRQYRAYFLLDDELGDILRDGDGVRVRKYGCSLRECECPDFRDRRLPCKHIYAVALENGIALPLDRATDGRAREKGLEIVFEFDTSRLDPLSKL